MSGSPEGVPGLADPGESPATAGLSGSELQQRAIGGSFWTALHTIISVPVAFLANAVVARSLGVSDYGQLAFLTMAFVMATQIANAGFSASLVQWGAAAEATGNRSRTDTLLRRSLGFHLAIELPLLCLAVFMLVGGEGPVVVAALLGASLLTCLFGGSTLAVTIENRSAAAAKLAIVSNFALQGAVALVAVILPTPEAVLSARLLAAAVLVPAHLFLLDPRRRRLVLQPKLPRAMPRGFWLFAGQSFVAGLLGALVFSRSEIFLLTWLSTSEAAGLFALAFGLSYQLTAPVDAMLNPLLPAVAGLVSAHPHLAQRALLRATRFAALLSGVITSVLLPAIYFGLPLIYGEDFSPAAAILIPLAVISCLQSVSQPVTAFIYARQRGRLLLNAHALALVANVIIALALIEPFGVWGAVVANAAGQTVALLMLVHHELKAQGLRLRVFLVATRLWWISCLSGTAAIGLGWLIATHATNEWSALVAAPAIGAVLLVAGGRWTRSGILVSDQAPLINGVPGKLRLPAAVMTRLFLTRDPVESSRTDRGPDQDPPQEKGD